MKSTRRQGHRKPRRVFLAQSKISANQQLIVQWWSIHPSGDLSSKAKVFVNDASPCSWSNSCSEILGASHQEARAIGIYSWKLANSSRWYPIHCRSQDAVYSSEERQLTTTNNQQWMPRCRSFGGYSQPIIILDRTLLLKAIFFADTCVLLVWSYTVQ